jgi:hypothetical protein
MAFDCIYKHGVRKSYTFLKVHELENKQQKLEGKVDIKIIL